MAPKIDKTSNTKIIEKYEGILKIWNNPKNEEESKEKMILKDMTRANSTMTFLWDLSGFVQIYVL